MQMSLMLKFQPNSKYFLDLRQLSRQKFHRAHVPMGQNGRRATMEKHLIASTSANQHIMEVAAILNRRYC